MTRRLSNATALLVLALCSVCAAPTIAQTTQEAPVKKPQPLKKSQPRRRNPNPAFAKVVDDPALPRVLLIGDSISIGYTLPVQELLKGAANVHRIPVNGGPTTRGLAAIDEWLGKGNWDVIHFNWGLHDLKYVNENGGRAEVDSGKPQVPIDEYEANLHKLVKRLQQTKAKLIWRSTTPIPEGAKGRLVGDEERYNAVAAKMMEEAGISIDDHYTFCITRLDELQKPADVHFTSAGSEALAKQTVAAIKHALSDQ